MKELEIGGFVYSTMGRDQGNYYMIYKISGDNVYLVDGKLRTLDRPKKKNKKHIRRLNHYDPEIIEKINTGTIKNEEIKRALKLISLEETSKEV